MAETPQKNIVTPDFTDKTSWHWDAGTATDEVLTDSGDGLTFNSANANWINLENVPDRDALTGYGIVVKIDDVTQTTGFTINYASGTVTFDSSQSGKTIKATYKFAQTSKVEITCDDANKAIIFTEATAQMSVGCVFSDVIVFEAWLNNGQTGFTWVKVGETTYFHPRDIIARADKVESVPAIWGMTKDAVKIYWDWDKKGKSIQPYRILKEGETCNTDAREFNKIVVKIKNDGLITSADFAVATLIMHEEDR